MAQSITDVDQETPPKTHNLKGRQAAHRRLRKDLIPIEKEIEDAKAKKKKIRKEWAAATGMTLADYDQASRLAGIEDDDERRDKVANMAEIYNSLTKGETIDVTESAHYPGDAP